MINLKNNRGAITLYILVSLVFFIIAIVSVQTNLKSKEARLESEYQKIQASYAKDANEVYDNVCKEILEYAKYFEYTYNDEDQTAVIESIKEQYLPTVTLYTKDDAGNLIEDAIGNQPLYILDGTKKITNLVIPQTVINGEDEYTITDIQNAVFQAPDKSTYTYDDEIMFTKVIIPDTVTAIGASAFANQSKLQKVVLPNQGIRFLMGVFQDCTSLSKVTYKGITYTDYNELVTALEENRL